MNDCRKIKDLNRDEKEAWDLLAKLSGWDTPEEEEIQFERLNNPKCERERESEVAYIWDEPFYDSYSAGVLGLTMEECKDSDKVKRAHRTLAMQAHPDRGGSIEMMKELNVARDALLG